MVHTVTIVFLKDYGYIFSILKEFKNIIEEKYHKLVKFSEKFQITFDSFLRTSTNVEINAMKCYSTNSAVSLEYVVW